MASLSGGFATISSAIAKAFTVPFSAGTHLPHLTGDSRVPISFCEDDLAEYRSELLILLHPTKRLLQIYRSVLILVRTIVIAIASIAAVSGLYVTGLLEDPWWRNYLFGLVVVWGVVVALKQRVSYLDVARVVDRRLDLKAQLGTAVDLLAREHGRLPTPLARTQLRVATQLAKEVDTDEAVSPALPRRELKLLLVSISLAGLFSLPWLQPDHLPVQAARAQTVHFYDDDLLWQDLDPEMARYLTAESRSSSGLQRTLDSLRSQLLADDISASEYAARVAAIEYELLQQAEDSGRQQEALNELAHALADASAARSVAESINRGDYAKAARDLVELGRQSDRLSPQARDELAARLREAARQIADANPSLAERAERVASALESDEPEMVALAMEDLAGMVIESGQSLASRTDLADALRELREGRMRQQGTHEDFLLNEEELAQLLGERTDGSTDRPGHVGTEVSEDTASGLGYASGHRLDGSDTGAGAGSGRGDNLRYGSRPLALQAGPEANLLQLRGRPLAQAPTLQSEGPDEMPLTTTSEGVKPSGESDVGVLSTSPIVVSGESNFVPLEMRPVVRDYFSRFLDYFLGF